MNNIQVFSEEKFLDYLNDGAMIPLLLSFTADWCTPCQLLLPTLESVHKQSDAKIIVAKIDIDAYPDLATRLGVRSVPTTILFGDCIEKYRFIGVKSARSVFYWLASKNIKLLNENLMKNSPLSAFHGDDSLKKFLVERLFNHIDNGEVSERFLPWWNGGSGSISAAFVHNISPSVFQQVTGLPSGLAFVLEFLGINSRQDADVIFSAFRPGTDAEMVPLRFVYEWLNHELLHWSEALSSPLHDEVRRAWIDNVGSLLRGEHVSAETWSRLREWARSIATEDGDPQHLLEDDLSALVALLSPPPPATASDEWQTILLARCRFSCARLLEWREGWTKQDSAKPDLREKYFRENISIDSAGEFDPIEFNVKKEQWNEKNSAFLDKEERLNVNYFSKMSEFKRPFIFILAEILNSL